MNAEAQAERSYPNLIFLHFNASTFVVPYLYQFSTEVQKLTFLVLSERNFHFIWSQFSIIKNYAGTALSSPSALKHQRSIILNAQLAFFGAKKMQM